MTNKKLQDLIGDCQKQQKKLSLEQKKERMLSSSLSQANEILRCLKKVRTGTLTHALIKDINEDLLNAASEDVQIAQAALAAKREQIKQAKESLSSICSQISYVESQTGKVLVKIGYNDISYGDYIKALIAIYRSNIGAIKRQCLQTMPNYDHYEMFTALHEDRFANNKIAHVAIRQPDMDALMEVIANTGYKGITIQTKGKNHRVALEIHDEDYIKLAKDKLGLDSTGKTVW